MRKIIDKGLNDCYNGNISFGVLNVEGNLVHGFIGSYGPFFCIKTEINTRRVAALMRKQSKITSNTEATRDILVASYNERRHLRL